MKPDVKKKEIGDILSSRKATELSEVMGLNDMDEVNNMTLGEAIRSLEIDIASLQGRIIQAKEMLRFLSDKK